MPLFSSLNAVLTSLEQRESSLPELVRLYLDRIKENSGLNAYVEVFDQEALERAATLQDRYEQDPASVGRLFGMVVSIKDVLSLEGHGVTAGSRMLEGFTSLYTATAVERLLAEDAIIIGRTNCDEFAMGSTNETSVYGPARNPVDPERVPGGSSGGSAVAVATDTCLASIGSDTGGSVRQPAAYCGVIGLKPTYGRISRHGLLAYGSSFDQIGILSRDIHDTALLLEVMAGADEYDATVSRKEVPAYTQKLDKGGPYRIAYFPETLNHPGLDPDIATATHTFIQQLEKEGHTLEEAPFPLLEQIIPAYYVLTTAEASSNLSRYDGIRFGYRSEEAHDLLETYRRSRTEGFGREVKRRIMLGTFVLSSGYYDAYYAKAQRVRRLIQDATFSLLEKYDFLLMPAAPCAPQRLGDSLDDPVAMYLADIFTVQANMAGIPAISLPVGKDSRGLPIGLQLMAGRFEEGALLRISQELMESGHLDL